MKTKMTFITTFTALGAIGSLAVYAAAGVPLFWIFTITFGTCFYHFAVRLIAGYTIDVLFYNEKWDYTWSWFKQNSIEAKLYKIFKVKTWKNRMPPIIPKNLILKITAWIMLLERPVRLKRYMR